MWFFIFNFSQCPFLVQEMAPGTKTVPSCEAKSGCIPDRICFLSSLHVSCLFVVPPQPRSSIRISLEGGKMFQVFDSKPWLHITQVLFLTFWKRENNVTMCYTQWGRKNERAKQRESTNKTGMRTGWDRERDEEREGTVKEKKKKRGKALAFVVTVPLPW